MVGYETSGRSSQKLRTRDALKAAATELIAAGEQPTVAEVATAANISRSTAYRYFPSQELMYAEIALTSTLAADRRQLDVVAAADGDPAERLDHLIRIDHALTITHEHALRAGLRAFLLLIDRYPDAPREPSNRVRYLATALSPLADRIPAPTLRRLVAALSLCVGIEAAIVTQVNCGLSADEAEDAKRWAAAALLRAALDEADASPTAHG